MSKKKGKKSTQHTQMGGYKKFLFDMYEAVKNIGFTVELEYIPNSYKRMMYDFRVKTPNPEAANALVSTKELKMITQKIKSYYREKNINVNDVTYSTYQLMLSHCYIDTRSKLALKEIGDENAPEILKMKEMTDELFKIFYSNYILTCFRIVIQLGNPDFKYYGVDVEPVVVNKGSPHMELAVKIYGVPAQKYMMNIDGTKRPTFRLGKAVATKQIEWITVDKTILGSFYTGQKEVLDVYIQSHALKRLSQRLDLLDREAINHLLWENTRSIEQFETYKGYLLLPFKLFGVKVGYLLAKVVEDKLLFRTFLFVTHNYSPEGDKLKEISGFGRHDISYWRIDRLSTFVNLDGEKYPDLVKLFEEAGMEDFMQLKDKDFNVDHIQSTNLDGLMKYLQRGQQADKVQEKEFRELIANM